MCYCMFIRCKNEIKAQNFHTFVSKYLCKNSVWCNGGQRCLHVYGSGALKGIHLILHVGLSRYQNVSSQYQYQSNFTVLGTIFGTLAKTIVTILL